MFIPVHLVRSTHNIPYPPWSVIIVIYSISMKSKQTKAELRDIDRIMLCGLLRSLPCYHPWCQNTALYELQTDDCNDHNYASRQSKHKKRPGARVCSPSAGRWLCAPFRTRRQRLLETRAHACYMNQSPARTRDFLPIPVLHPPIHMVAFKGADLNQWIQIFTINLFRCFCAHALLQEPS